MSDLLFSPKGEELWLNDPEKTPGPPCQLSRRLPSPVVLQAIIEADAFSTIIKEQEVSHATQMVLAVGHQSSLPGSVAFSRAATWAVYDRVLRVLVFFCAS